MAKLASYDAVVVGAGPNGLAAAIVLARAGMSVLLVEAHDRVGGGTRTEELTLPGYSHDVCSAIHPMAAASPFFRALPLAGIRSHVHRPARGARASARERDGAMLETSIDATASALGVDARCLPPSHRAPVRDHERLFPELWPAARGPRTRSCSPVRSLGAALGAGARRRAVSRPARRARSWPGAPPIRYFRSIALPPPPSDSSCSWPGTRTDGRFLAAARKPSPGPSPAYFDVAGRRDRNRTPDSIARRAAAAPGPCSSTSRPASSSPSAAIELPARYRGRLADIATVPASSRSIGRSTVPSLGKRELRARGAPSTWAARSKRSPTPRPRCGAACTPSDPTCSSRSKASSTPRARPRAGTRAGPIVTCLALDRRHDATSSRARSSASPPAFAIAFSRDSACRPPTFESYNENYVGGDITGGVTDLGQLFTRPVARVVPYATPQRGIYICSSSTPPGAGVHGMCGYWAARAALRRVFGRTLMTGSGACYGFHRQTGARRQGGFVSDPAERPTCSHRRRLSDTPGPQTLPRLPVCLSLQ